MAEPLTDEQFTEKAEVLVMTGKRKHSHYVAHLTDRDIQLLHREVVEAAVYQPRIYPAPTEDYVQTLMFNEYLTNVVRPKNKDHSRRVHALHELLGQQHCEAMRRQNPVRYLHIINTNAYPDEWATFLALKRMGINPLPEDEEGDL